MITQVGSQNSISCATRDPRRKSQSVQFRNRSIIPYKGENIDVKRQQNSALLSSLAIVAGSVLFTMGFFLLSAIKNMKK